MQFSLSFVRSVYAAVMLASVASALPFTGSAVGADKTVESFHPESSFEVRTGCVISEHGMPDACLASDLRRGRG